jgi:hypothetical protein
MQGTVTHTGIPMSSYYVKLIQTHELGYYFGSLTYSHTHRYLYEKREGLFQDGSKHVIELGAGLGLCGLLAARLNPSGVVVLSDGDELTMERVSGPEACKIFSLRLRREDIESSVC